MYMLTLTLTLLCVCWSTGASLIQGAPPPLTDVLGAVPTGHSGDWAVEVQQGQERAREVAQKFGLYFVGQIGNLDNYYHFRRLQNVSSAREPSHSLTRRSLSQAIPAVDQKLTDGLKKEVNVGYVEQQTVRKMSKRDYQLPTDPSWTQQWSLLNTGQTDGQTGRDLNVEPVWIQGVTGLDVVISVVDEGIETRHSELASNYDSLASYDFVNSDGDPTPDPVDHDQSPHDHGTACAGVVAMAKDNDQCGVGVAYDCSIGGLKLNLDYTSDLLQAAALGYHDNHIDVYSVSWGPPDFGFFVGKPGPLLAGTLRNGVRQGRAGKGAVYVWAAGNGGRYSDSCSADAYASSMYTISVGSADQQGRLAVYDEQCPSKMAVTFSYNSETYPSNENSTVDPYNQITTASLNGQCRGDFTGTSASAPLMSGVVALTLQANSNLTWRDVQYLVVYTSDSSSLQDGDWVTNGAGLNVSHKFGFGAIDAEAMVTRGQRWINVPSQRRQNTYGSLRSGTARRNQPLTVYFDVSQSSIGYLEHVLVKMSLHVQGYSRQYGIEQYIEETHNITDEELLLWLQQPHPRRGDIKIDLTSPQGTVSHLLPYRQYDFVNDEGYSSWPFLSVHNWGENPIGRWTLTITFKSTSGYVSVSGIGMSYYGVQQTPEAVSNIPSQCDSTCTRQCSGLGQANCDVCSNLRVVPTLECVDVCPEGTRRYKRFCTTPSDVSTEDNRSPIPSLTIPSSSNTPHTTSAVIYLDTNSIDNSNQVPLSVKAGTIVLAGALMVLILGVIVSISVYVCYRHRKRSTGFQVLTSAISDDTVDTGSITV